VSSDDITKLENELHNLKHDAFKLEARLEIMLYEIEKVHADILAMVSHG
jgi:hypothetical protein